VPLYEYKCEGCGETFEVIQKFADEPLTVHEKCGGHVHRLMSAPSFQFKGSGWYATDYAKSSNSGSSKGDSSEKSAGDTATKTETKSETKTETKSDSKPASTEKAS
jgi:putative FmdB family regulatory protein